MTGIFKVDRSKKTHPPSHPGAVLKGLCMEPLGLSVSALAAHIGVSRRVLSQIVNERGRVTPDIARRLGQAFNTSPDMWIGLQSGRDLWEAKHGEGQAIAPLPRPPEDIHEEAAHTAAI